MKQIKVLAQYYVDLLVKLGIVRFSLLLALALVALAVVVQVGITLVLQGDVHDIDIVRSVFFGLLITPWAVYFLSVVVDQLEESRQRLSKLVSKLEEMRSRDLELNRQLTENIHQLNQQIEERERAEEARHEAMKDLENEVSTARRPSWIWLSRPRFCVRLSMRRRISFITATKPVSFLVATRRWKS